ncbi:hypothetical protein LXA43DRAFT_882089 [Ganoderma leucocontextum]|nr:hypothetical protein LXA43DRAFT_882089 [Ganoderma leucocontextum]
MSEPDRVGSSSLDDTTSPTYDILINILDWLDGDYTSLYRCSQVNRMFRDAAATYLYRSVTYSPPFSLILNLRKQDDFAQGLFSSARLPHNAALVRRLEVSGYLSTRPPPLNKFPGQLKSIVECWTNLQSVTFAPRKYHTDTFNDTLPLLLSLPFLQHLTLNPSCMGEAHVATVPQLRNLQSLTIQSPTRAVLQILPDWLRGLRPTLRSFHLRDNCGSVTPGVLRAFLPHMQEITAFTLGLSYSLTDDDVFVFCEDLPLLQILELRYYLQMRPTRIPRLSRLRYLTVHCNYVMNARDAAYLYKWVRRTVTYAPLESLRLICEPQASGAAPSFDPLLEHLIARHARRLRILDLREFFVGKKALKRLCHSCPMLEDLFVTVSSDTLSDLQNDPNQFQRLQRLGVNTRTSRDRKKITTEAAETFMRSVPKLQRLVVNGDRFEVR